MTTCVFSTCINKSPTQAPVFAAIAGKALFQCITSFPDKTNPNTTIKNQTIANGSAYADIPKLVVDGSSSTKVIPIKAWGNMSSAQLMSNPIHESLFLDLWTKIEVSANKRPNATKANPIETSHAST